jgi:hypothetical protein
MSKSAEEVILIWVAIILFCGVMALMQHRDQQAQQQALTQELAKLKGTLTRTCIYKHGVDEIHYLNCKVVNEHYAVLN